MGFGQIKKIICSIPEKISNISATHQKWGDRLLLLSGIVLWESLLAAIWFSLRGTYGDFESQGDYLTAGVIQIQFRESLSFGHLGIVLLLIYTLLRRPWRMPHRCSVNYWLQVIVALVILGWTVQVFINEYGTEPIVLHTVTQSAPNQ